MGGFLSRFDCSYFRWDPTPENLNEREEVVDSDRELASLPLAHVDDVAARARTGDLVLWMRYHGTEQSLVQRIIMWYTKSYVTHVELVVNEPADAKTEPYLLGFDTPGLVRHDLRRLHERPDGVLHKDYEMVWLPRRAAHPVPRPLALGAFIEESRDKTYELDFIDLYRATQDGNLRNDTDRFFCSEFCQEALTAAGVLCDVQPLDLESGNTVPHEFLLKQRTFCWAEGESGFGDPYRMRFD